MRSVRDRTGNRYILLKRSADSWLVRDPRTGEEEYRPSEELTPTGRPPMETAATAIPAPVRTLITRTGTEASVGLLVELADRGPTPVRTLLDIVELCESDLHGALAELQAGDLITETDIDGQPGYRLTETGAQAITLLRSLDVGDETE